jgi:hypothetical protein
MLELLQSEHFREAIALPQVMVSVTAHACPATVRAAPAAANTSKAAAEGAAIAHSCSVTRAKVSLNELCGVLLQPSDQFLQPSATHAHCAQPKQLPVLRTGLVACCVVLHYAAKLRCAVRQMCAQHAALSCAVLPLATCAG